MVSRNSRIPLEKYFHPANHLLLHHTFNIIRGNGSRRHFSSQRNLVMNVVRLDRTKVVGEIVAPIERENGTGN